MCHLSTMVIHLGGRKGDGCPLRLWLEKFRVDVGKGHCYKEVYVTFTFECYEINCTRVFLGVLPYRCPHVARCYSGMNRLLMTECGRVPYGSSGQHDVSLCTLPNRHLRTVRTGLWNSRDLLTLDANF